MSRTFAKATPLDTPPTPTAPRTAMFRASEHQLATHQKIVNRQPVESPDSNPLTRVLTALRLGVATDKLATTLGIDQGLADLALDHWVQQGVVTPAGQLGLLCVTCAPGTEPTTKPAKCVGCPFARAS